MRGGAIRGRRLAGTVHERGGFAADRGFAPGGLEESFFLGLRLTQGVNLRSLATKFGEEAVEAARAAIAELVECGLMERRGEFFV